MGSGVDGRHRLGGPDGLWTPTAWAWWNVGDPGDGMTETGHMVIGFLYMPLALWSP